MIGIAIIIFTLAYTLFDKPHLFKLPLSINKIIIFSLLILTAVISSIKEFKSDTQQDSDSQTIAFLKGQSTILKGESDSLLHKIDSFRNDSRISQQQYDDSIRLYHKDNKAEIKDVAYNMTKIFAENSKLNQEEHKTTQHKIDHLDTTANRGVSAYIDLLADPSSVFTISRKGDLTTFNIRYVNVGRVPAYKVKTNMYVIIKYNGRYYKYTSLPNQTINLSPGSIFNTNFSASIQENFYNSVEEFYFVIIGEYFIDDDLKIKKKIELATKLTNKTFKNSIYDLNISISDFLKMAIPIQ